MRRRHAALQLVLPVLLPVLLLVGCAVEPVQEATPRGAPPEPDAPAATSTVSDPSSEPPRAERTRDARPAPETPSRDPLAEAVEGLEPIDEQVLGADVSWPQCPKGMGIAQKRSQGAPMPLDTARFVVIGLTNGPGFYANPCLADQVAWVRERHLMAAAYAVASYPEPERLAEHADDGPFDGATSTGALSNTGYAQAAFNIASMRASGLRSPIVWIDVEPVPDFEWSSDRAANAAVVRGLARGYEDAGYAVGIYSTPYLWEGVVGGLVLGVPEWRAAGQTSMQEALSRCGDDWVIQAGFAAIAQWVQDGRDVNVTCPGTSTDLARWFHQY